MDEGGALLPRPAPRRWGRVLAAAGGAAAMLSALRALGGERRPAALSARDATARRVRASNEYTETHGAAGRGYPWLRDATLVEPYRDTKLWVDGDDGDDGDDARLVWAATQVSNLAGGAAAEAHAHVGAVATWQFETLGAHAVEVAARLKERVAAEAVERSHRRDARVASSSISETEAFARSLPLGAPPVVVASALLYFAFAVGLGEGGGGSVGCAVGGGGASLPSCVCIVGGFVSVRLRSVGCAVGGGGALSPSCECIVGGFVSVSLGGVGIAVGGGGAFSPSCECCVGGFVSVT